MPLAALISGAFGLLGAGLNSSSQDHAAELNYRSTQETNAQNYKIWQEQLAAQRQQYEQEKAENRFLVQQQRDWSLADRDFENEYNSPAALKQRYIQAGINPYLAMQGQNSIGSASATGSTGNNPTSQVPQAPVMQAPQTSPTDYSGFGLAAQRAFELYLQSQKQEADISALRAHSQIEAMDTLSKAVQRGFQNQKLKAEMDKIMQDFKFTQDSWLDQQEAIKLANEKIRADQYYQVELTRSLQFANSVAPELHELTKRQFASNITVASAQYAELMSRSDLNNKQKDLVGKQIVNQCFLNSNLPKQLHNENAIRVATYKQIKNQAALIEQQTETETWNTLDARKGYRKHIGSDRSLEDIIQYTLKRGKMPGLQ